jgi:DNA-3-methyladenine glycosylase II
VIERAETPVGTVAFKSAGLFVRHEMSREAARALSTDDVLAPVVEEHGPLELEPADDIFERLVVAIVRQQVSMDAAAAIRERLFETVDVSPATLRGADTGPLTEAGLSAAKAEYVQNVARAFDERGYDRPYFADRPDAEVLTELTEIRGIGPWTGKMFLLFCLGRPDVFPVEDLGIRKGMELVTGGDLDRPAMCDRAEQWQPYRSYASLYLWRAYEA